MDKLVQWLEPRRLLAVIVEDGRLEVSGDDNGNSIRLSVDTAAGEIVISVDGQVDRFLRSAFGIITVFAAGGNDLIDLSGSVERATGPLAIERVNAGDGDDTVIGTPVADFIVAGGGNDSVEGRGGDDLIFGEGGIDTLLGQGNRDQIDGGPGSDLIDGGTGADTLLGKGGVDQLFGQGGSDQLSGGAGDDLLDGGSALDFASYAERAAGVAVTLDGTAGNGEPGENDLILATENAIGGDGNDSIVGNGGSNGLIGNAGNDTLIGLGGDDGFDGGDGNDSMDGGTGDDRFDDGEGNDTCRGRDGQDSVTAGGGTNVFDGGQGIGLISFTGRAEPLTISVDGIANDGAAGENSNITGFTSLVGGRGNDLIIGGVGDETLMGFIGNDTLLGNGGDDRIEGGADDDSLDGGSGDDLILGEGGDDLLFGRGGDDTMSGGPGVRGEIRGGRGNDFITLGDAAEDVRGEAGADLIHVPDEATPRPDSISGGTGADVVAYLTDADVRIVTNDLSDDGPAGDSDNVARDFESISTGRGNDLISAGGLDRPIEIHADAGDDTIFGGDSADLLIGDAGNDSITGGGGEDRMRGGFGDDTFRAFDNSPDFINGGDGEDSAGTDGVDQTISVEVEL